MAPCDAKELIAKLRAENEALKHERERCFQLLQAAGIPRDRAKSTDNGINVLATRYDRAIDEKIVENDLLQRAVEWIITHQPTLARVNGETWIVCQTEVPAEFAAIIKSHSPKAGG